MKATQLRKRKNGTFLLLECRLTIVVGEMQTQQKSAAATSKKIL
jgi:hypothetical protein